MTFQAWTVKFLNYLTFQVFNDLLNPAVIGKACSVFLT